MCGTRASDTARKCLVCGTSLSRPPDSLVQRRRPNYPSPVALAMLAAMLAAAAWMLLVANGTLPMPAMLVPPSPTITPTFTMAPTGTPTRTPTPTPLPTITPLPPITYRVKDGDSCLLIAIIHNVSVESIIIQNNLDPNCIIHVGRDILVPQPTPTPTSTVDPMVTLAPGQPTPIARPTYVVQAGDTCIAIAHRYGISTEELMAINGIVDCALLRQGQVLVLPYKPDATATPAAP
jgi:LysM repeat protein